MDDKQRATLVKMFKNHDIDAAEIEGMRQALAGRFGQEPSAADIAWGVLNDPQPNRDHHVLPDLAQTVGEILYQLGDDPAPAKRFYARLAIQQWMNSDIVTGVKLMAAAGCCDECKKWSKRVMTLEEALDDPPFPCPTCTGKRHPDDKYAWCRCGLIPLRD